jgi:hypothetical protein
MEHDVKARYDIAVAKADAKRDLYYAVADASSIKELDALLQNDLTDDWLRQHSDRLRSWLKVCYWSKRVFFVGLGGAIVYCIVIAII